MYRIVYSEDAVRQLLQIRPAGARELILKAINSLGGNPYQKGKFLVVDSAGRENAVMILPGAALTFWADHAVREVRIVDISRLPRS